MSRHNQGLNNLGPLWLKLAHSIPTDISRGDKYKNSIVRSSKLPLPNNNLWHSALIEILAIVI